MLGDFGPGEAFELEEDEHFSSLFGERREDRVEASEVLLSLGNGLGRAFGRQLLGELRRHLLRTLARPGRIARDADGDAARIAPELLNGQEAEVVPAGVEPEEDGLEAVVHVGRGDAEPA